MAFLDTIRNWFGPTAEVHQETIVPAPSTTYAIKPLTAKHSGEVIKLNRRCFKNGENYTKHTFAYLFNEPSAISYQIVTAEDEMAGFAFVLTNRDGTAHLTTIGVAPEHRRRGLGEQLLQHLDEVLRAKGISTMILEVRVQNHEARALYQKAGYSVVNRIAKYYSDGEDCFMMVKSIV